MADLKLRADLPDERPVHAHPIDIVLADGWQTTVATVNSEFIEPAEVERRALLLAAAPELLAALTAQRCFWCVQWIEVAEGERRPCNMCAPALAAIAKARGEAADAS